MGPGQRDQLLINISRLRRAERRTGDADVARVRAELEDELGETVPKATAARLLGVSHTALNSWIERGSVPVVLTERGRQAVPVSALLDLHEAVRETNREKPNRRHKLEPVLIQDRRRAQSSRPHLLVKDVEDDGDRHRRSELRSLAYHRAVAPRLRRRHVDKALEKIDRWEETGRIHPVYANAWREVLDLPVSEIRRVIRADTQEARDLRQNSPFAGLISESERRKIVARV